MIMTKHNFEAETGQILELLTHSIYSNKEIFLREIISNASDAIDKARLKSLTDTNFLGEDNEFKITIVVDKEANTIEVSDNGIGMTKDELHKNIGTIAKSGTKDFMEKLKKAKETKEHNLIGQFGVGFYSSYMVADKVELETKSPLDENSYKWISDGKSGYEVSLGARKERGTTVKIFVNETNKELLEEWKIRELIKKYSNYVGVPIMMKELENEQNKDKEKKFEQVNQTKSIWTKNKSEVKKEEYEEFYKTVSMDFNPPLAYSHNNVEGIVSYKSLIYIPKQKNMFADLSDPNKDYGPKLYVQNVLILENAKALLPVWLRFVSGVVETNDIPLNVSRELLQSNTVLEKIKKGLVKKVITELKKSLKNSPEDYDVFLSNFSNFLKEGVYYEGEKEEIASLLKFKSMKTGKMITLDEYLESAKEETITVPHNHEHKEGEKCEHKEETKTVKTIYFINGKSESEVKSSPYLEQFRDNDVDVLFLTDPIDSFLIQAFTEYKGNKLKSATSSDISLKEETKEEAENKEKNIKKFKDFLELVKNIISSDKIEKVELNEKLGTAVSALKTPDGGMNPQMEKMMKSMGQDVPAQKRILELNPNSSLVKAMKTEFNKDVKSKKLSKLINYTYSQAVLLEGGELENMAEFLKSTNEFAKDYLK
ncbi:molecular chaperone HtpG [Candidatus Gracilibacteria bacterium]|nr:MAG: molecular chaperone HtpG [Candidatus Gracilibacteria bacterium]PIE85791.1 MAG: molecular chaperone HtpG [Candidatus Gracilibacteria bacterium]